MSAFEAFERAKIKRLIVSKGKSFEFFRSDLNAFGEPTDEYNSVGSINGVYHEAEYHYISSTASDAGISHNEIQSMILCLKDEVSNALVIGDFVTINDKKYTIVKKKDINNLDIAWDISLEDSDNGSNS